MSLTRHQEGDCWAPTCWWCTAEGAADEARNQETDDDE